MKRLGRTVFCMCLGLASATSTRAQTEQHDHSPKGAAVKAGMVNFETSCSPAVKDDFNLAVAELHSFWFAEARSLFEGVAKKDPTCAIAHWGVALTYGGNPFAGQPSTQTIANGKAAVDKAQSTGTPTPREKGFIDAVAGLFSSVDVTTQPNARAWWPTRVPRNWWPVRTRQRCDPIQKASGQHERIKRCAL